MKKKLILGLLMAMVLGSILAMALAGEPKGDAKVKEPYKIGWVGPLTGIQQWYGVSLRNTIKMGFEEINRKGGIDGHMIEMIEKNDQIRPDVAVEVTRELIEKDKVIAVMGSELSNNVLASMKVCKEREIVQLCCKASLKLLDEQGNPYFFRSASSEPWTAKAVVSFLATKVGLTEPVVGLLRSKGTWEESGTKGFEVALAAVGGRPFKAAEVADAAASSYLPQLTKLRGAGVKVLAIYMFAPEVARSLINMRAMGWSPIVVGAITLSSRACFEASKGALEGAYFCEPADPTRADVQELWERYRVRYGEAPDYLSLVTEPYTGAMLMAEALKRAKGDPTKMKDAFESIRDFPSYAGGKGETINFSPTNHSGVAYSAHLVKRWVPGGKGDCIKGVEVVSYPKE